MVIVWAYVWFCVALAVLIMIGGIFEKFPKLLYYIPLVIGIAYSADEGYPTINTILGTMTGAVIIWDMWRLHQKTKLAANETSQN